MELNISIWELSGPKIFENEYDVVTFKARGILRVLNGPSGTLQMRVLPLTS